MHNRWEYKIIHISTERWTSTGLPGDINEKFDELGAQGWELVRTESILRGSIAPIGASMTVGIVAIFKRPLENS